MGRLAGLWSSYRVVVCVAAACIAACSSKIDDSGGEVEQPDPGQDPDCNSTRALFAQRVWTDVLDRVCINCHSPDGVATAQNAQLQLLPSAYPGFLDANYDNVSLMARYAFDGKSVLLRKPLGEMDHGGGAQLREDSEEYAVLEEFVDLLEDEDACDLAPPPPVFDDVRMLSPAATFRKATIHLASRLPTPQEHQRLQDEGEAVLPEMLDAMLEEKAVLDRLKDLYNDQFLTDLYLRYTGFAINLLSEDQYPLAGAYYDDLEDDALRRKINTAVAREPLELIAYIVKNNRPFSEILTADYTVVNPFSAKVYAVKADFEDPDDEDEFVEAQVAVVGEDDLLTIPIPHAGVLTTPVFLNRFPSTPTNRNRHRARKVFEFFLATDILRVASRPIDPEASSRYNNPTRDDPQCTGCHRQIDPIAGAFLKWDDRDPEDYRPNRDWYPEMFPPGFGKEVMDTAEYGSAQRWLAQRIVDDPRFVLSTVHTVYRGITGREPLAYPDASAADFEALRRGWAAQDATFRRIGERFVEADMNLKVLLREFLLTPYFRADNAQELGDERALELGAVGTGRFSIPSVLSRKIEAVTGLRWARNWDSQDYLATDFNILYGGIDSDSVTQRLGTPNGVMASVAWRMANEMACAATALDFNRPRGERLLFPEVETSDVPETESGDAVPEAADRIKDNIRYLHFRVLGESLDPDDPELQRTYDLFAETWREGRDKLMSDEVGANLNGRCQARVDPDTGEELPDDQRLTRDENYAIRSWMAVVTYLLADYKFLYE